MCILLVYSDMDEHMTLNDLEEDFVVPDLDLGHYDRIHFTGNDHNVTLIPSSVMQPHLHGLQLLHTGATAVRIDTKESHTAVCYIKLENDNATISWTKTNWSSLRGMSAPVSPDYVFQGDQDRPVSPCMVNRYIGGLTAVDDLDEGHLDLLQVKKVTLGAASYDLNLLGRKHNIHNLSPKQNCICFLVGTSISDNKTIEFVLPPLVLKSWFESLERLFQASRFMQHSLIDRRVLWLKDLYLQLYYEAEACLAPTSADAIRAFGGRNWNTEINSNTNEAVLSPRKSNSPAGSLKAAKMKKKSYSLPAFKV